eukprot:CAMPEP_0171465922 /NCGR_PEP_ID=MMETSP0945-20130129/8867_1 /TAXON_ID=109269 /ORGANISM="Vaucheria litorea, Strain CCMP2940" /LENGTH=616 /DNA_ID=CAMNT_0011993747 /DNA_START=566 /DNA_END=2413 /DNA_ORIENTATION=+
MTEFIRLKPSTHLRESDAMFRGFSDAEIKKLTSELCASSDLLSNISKGFMLPKQNKQDPLYSLKSWWDCSRTFMTPADIKFLRQEMLSHFGGRQFLRTMRDGAKIDCCLIGPSDELSPSTTRIKNENRCILFCNPNAAFYESYCLGSGQMRKDWISYYTALGCHICMFNYRGYGQSEGKPSPKKIISDAEEIVAYLRESEKMEYIGIHGESIGGMVASSVAHKAQVDLAILDRTFSSLPAAAQRLLGPWTDFGLWLVTGWSTDSATNYMKIKCPKLIACDPNDAIIADTASLKVGVALLSEIGTRKSWLTKLIERSEKGYTTYAPLSVPRSYSLTDYMGVPPPRCSDVIFRNSSLSINMIIHFSACIRDVGRRATASMKSNLVSCISTNRSLDYEMSSLNSDNGISCMENGNMNSNGSESSDSGLEDESAYLRKKEEFNRKDIYDMESTYSVENYDSFSPLVKLWKILCKIDNFCGRKLGSASVKGFDEMRAWVCCLLTWSHRNLGGSRLEAMNHLESALFALRTMIHDFPIDLASDASIDYIIGFFDYFVDRLRREIGEVSTDDMASKTEMEEVEEVAIAATKDIGILLPVSCGHNATFSHSEKRKLQCFLAREG